ncbi:hypothetical protein VKA52_01400 [Halobacillus sp. HZG1]|nr:hypothetical protein [Halobacillus sp. HZG1]
MNGPFDTLLMIGNFSLDFASFEIKKKKRKEKKTRDAKPPNGVSASPIH